MKALLIENCVSVLEGLFLTSMALVVGVLGSLPLGIMWTYTEIRDAWWCHFKKDKQ